MRDTCLVPVLRDTWLIPVSWDSLPLPLLLKNRIIYIFQIHLRRFDIKFRSVVRSTRFIPDQQVNLVSRPFDKQVSSVSLRTILPSILGKWNPWSLGGANPETVMLSSSFGLRVSSYLVVSVNSDSVLKSGRTNLSC